jgi:hypothetical protein
MRIPSALPSLMRMFGQHAMCLQVFMLDSGGGSSRGWTGEVLSDKLAGQPPADPFSCEALAGRYQVLEPSAL